MNRNNSEVYEALVKIAKMANQTLDKSGEEEHEYESWEEDGGELPSCTPKSIPERLLVKAADVAYRINPMNAPGFTAFAQTTPDFQVMEPQRISILTTKYWGAKPRQLTVSFMEQTPTDLRKRIISYMNAWSKRGGISFVWTQGTGHVRISRGNGGYYSYLGTDILLIPRNRQTMNLEAFTMNTPESEYRRVICHEVGHTLGFPHEHMRKALVARIDPAKAYAYFWRMQRWDKATVDAQVLTPLDERSLLGTPPDQTSIMCYQLPGSITRDGKPILGGMDINATDYAFCGAIYPKPGLDISTNGDESEWTKTATPADEWDEVEDVAADFDSVEA